MGFCSFSVINSNNWSDKHRTYIKSHHLPPPKPNMTSWKIHHEWVDVFPIEHRDFPASHVSFQGSLPNRKLPKKNVAAQVSAPALLSASFSADVTLKRFSTRSGRSTWMVLWQALGPVEGTRDPPRFWWGRKSDTKNTSFPKKTPMAGKVPKVKPKEIFGPKFGIFSKASSSVPAKVWHCGCGQPRQPQYLLKWETVSCPDHCWS